MERGNVGVVRDRYNFRGAAFEAILGVPNEGCLFGGEDYCVFALGETAQSAVGSANCNKQASDYSVSKAVDEVVLRARAVHLGRDEGVGLGVQLRDEVLDHLVHGGLVNDNNGSLAETGAERAAVNSSAAPRENLGQKHKP